MKIDLSSAQITRFRRKIFTYYTKHRRNLPFRNTTDPYSITVSELMLQQTQVERVIDKYRAWIAAWPDWRSLAGASTRELLAAWSGLGYNRRAIYLGHAARIVVDRFDSVLPDRVDLLKTLPGIGPYTAAAILIFAHNRPIVAIDTNIRRVLIHELGLSPDMSARDLEHVALRVLPKRRSRDWHYALMDYSRLALPKVMPHIPPTSRQSKFEGSIRQIRGEIIRRLTRQRSVRVSTIARALGRSESDVLRAAHALSGERLVHIRDAVITLR